MLVFGTGLASRMNRGWLIAMQDIRTASMVGWVRNLMPDIALLVGGLAPEQAVINGGVAGA